MGRNISKVICPCGNKTEEVPATEQERKEYGCFRDTEKLSCCVTAYQCKKCDIRFTIVFASPEVC